MSKVRDVMAVTIANGQSLSGPFQTNGRRLHAILMPAAWTAADLSFQALLRQVGATQTFGEVVDAAGANLAVTAPAADEVVSLHALPLEGLGMMKIRSGPVGAAVAQGAARTLYVVLGD